MQEASVRLLVGQRQDHGIWRFLRPAAEPMGVGFLPTTQGLLQDQVAGLLGAKFSIEEPKVQIVAQLTPDLRLGEEVVKVLFVELSAFCTLKTQTQWVTLADWLRSLEQNRHRLTFMKVMQYLSQDSEELEAKPLSDAELWASLQGQHSDS